MELKFDHLLPENWLHAFGATLFHSLWLGVLLAIIAGLIMFATRKTSAKIRYNLLTSCLLLFVLVISVAFYFELKKQANHSQIKLIGNMEVNVVNLSASEQIISTTSSNISTGISRALHVWNSYSFQIVLAWFLTICFKSIQLLFGMNKVCQLRKEQLYKAGKKWDECLHKLAERLALKQQVKLMHSGIAKIPMVVGHFKPLILIPLGLLNGLDTAEVEAILAHELAHIKRKDYLVNFLQSFIEIVFFFNPAVLWVSQLIKTEREHCCDDLAIACVNDRKNYVKALIFCQEFEQRAPAYAMGIMGQKGSLLHRVSRMLFDTNSTLNKMEKTILTIALVFTVICTVAFKNVSHAKTIEKKEISSFYQTMQDTVKAKQSNAKSADQIEKEIQQKIIAAEKKTIDGESTKIKQSKKTAEILSRADSLQAKKDAEQAVIDGIQADKDSKIAIEDAKQAKIDAAQAELDTKQAAKDAKQAKLDAKQAEIDSKQAIKDARQAKADAEIAQKEAKRNLKFYKGDKIPKAPKPPKAPRPIKGAPTTPPPPPTPLSPPAPPIPPSISGNASGVRKTGVERVVKSIHKTVQNGRDFTNEINKELINDQIISSTNNLSYKLNKTDLIVNGVKQSEEIQKKYKRKYLKNDNSTLMHNFLVEKSTTNN